MASKPPYPGVPGTPTDLWAECGSRSMSYEDYISQSKYPSQPETPLWSKSSKQWSGADFTLPWGGPTWYSNQSYYQPKPGYQPVPGYSPDIPDEELQRVLKRLGLPNAAPPDTIPTAPNPAPADALPETGPVAGAIAEYYRDRVV